MQKYWVVLFKNKERVKTLKRFVTLQKANTYFDFLTKNNNIIFDVKVENGVEVDFEIGLIDSDGVQKFPTYKTDSLGRQLKVIIDNEGMNILRISKYKKEELLYDIQLKKKINLNFFIKTYLSKTDLKVMSVLNNKVIVQRDESVFVFSLKNDSESIRFIQTLSSHFLIERRTDCLFVNDTSKPQKKYLLNLLSEKGFDKSIFYRKYTTFPSHKEQNEK